MKRFAQIKSAGELPSPRGVALAVIRMTQSSTVSLADLGRTIKADPALVGRLIKAANGMFHEGRRPIVSVQEALMVLGLPAVRGLALGFSLLSSYRKGRLQGFRLHTVLVLVAAHGAVDADAYLASARCFAG